MWRKSSRSNTGSQCVEVRNDLVALRDSKYPAGPMLTVRALPALIKDVKAGKFNR